MWNLRFLLEKLTRIGSVATAVNEYTSLTCEAQWRCGTVIGFPLDSIQ